jgi:hypothetical protein
MKPETTPKPPATYLNELLDNNPSGSSTSARVTNSPTRMITTVYPCGSQTKGQNDHG